MGGWSERVMGQKGFFDVERRLEAISAKGDPLETMRKMVRWEDFRADIEAVTETKAEERKSNVGRKPYRARTFEHVVFADFWRSDSGRLRAACRWIRLCRPFSFRPA